MILLPVILFSNITAQSTDSIDVKYLVQKQIEEAKKKNIAVSNISYETPVVKVPVKQVVMETNTIVGIPGDYFYKGIVMLTGAVVAFSWVGMRKTWQRLSQFQTAPLAYSDLVGFGQMKAAFRNLL